MDRKILKFVLVSLIVQIGVDHAISQSTRYHFTAERLGTTVGAVFYAESNIQINEVKDHFFQLLDSLNQIFSDYQPNSEISRIAPQGQKSRQPIQISEPLCDLLAKAIQISEITRGQFDVTIGSLTKLWRTHLAADRVPSKRKIRRARRSVDHRSIVLDTNECTLRFLKRNTSLDFGGIAKGYIGDQLAHFLRTQGIHSYLLDLGGDMIAGDPPPESSHWKIEIGWRSQVLHVENCSVATSGPDYQFFIHKGKRYSHIIDPSTGWGLSHPFNTTTISDQGWLSDAMASCAALLAPQETLAVATSLESLEVLIQRSGTLFQSQGFCNYIAPKF